MFTNVTWWQFFGTFLLLSAIYYPLVLSLYFRRKVTLFWRKFVVAPSDPAAAYGLVEDEHAPTTDSPSKTAPDPNADVSDSAAALMEDIKNGISAAADSRAGKDQLFALLKNTLAKYPQLKKAGRQVQINEFIIQEAVRHHYTIHMAQVYALWANATDVDK